MRPFLTAQWRDLVFFNWVIDPAVLAPYVPKGVTLDSVHGETYISVVAFRFEDTRVQGFSVPFHRSFEEVNLRFYVKRELEGELRRGVVFIKEIVPRCWVAALARALYNENYHAMPMTHAIERTNGDIHASYRWQLRSTWNGVSLRAVNAPTLPENGSKEQFIVEHYWGYAKQKDGSTKEYRVEHPAWDICTGIEHTFEANVAKLYGDNFHSALSRPPHFTLFASGSNVSVYPGARISNS